MPRPPVRRGQTWKALQQTELLRGCTDGAWRCLREGHALTSFGLLATVWDSHNKQFQTSFQVQAIAVTSSESSRVHEFIFETWCKCMSLCCGVENAADRMDQIHSDFHLGVRKAAAKTFPRAAKVLDWAHLVGAVRRTKAAAEQAWLVERQNAGKIGNRM